MDKKRGLGKGLNVMLSSTAATAVMQRREESKGALRAMPVEMMQRGKYQPRKEIHADSLQELADSIRAQGIIQPIVVRPVAESRYEIIAGERRWRAAQLAGLSEIPVLIRDVPDEAAMAMALIENIQRENLNPIEEAVALQRLLDECEMTHQQIAEAVGKSRTTITNLLRLLGLHPDVKTMLERGDLEMGHARAILGLEGQAQFQAAREVIAKQLSVRETEAFIRNLSKKKTASPALRADPDIRQLQQNLSEKLGALVLIKHRAKGKGQLVIRYNSVAELEGILERIK
jgi:ParB family chromosome partitioning protein